jgi:LemA protein
MMGFNANTIIAGLIIIFLGAALISYVVGLYNRLVLLKNNVAKAYANIDVLLMQRADEVPNLLAIVKGSQVHEQMVLKELASIRSQLIKSKNNNQRIQLSNQLNTAWGKTIAVIENYPDLKAGNAFLQLQSRMTELENHIADRREFFNESIALYNDGIGQFPAIIMAVLTGYRAKAYLQNAAAGNIGGA